VQMPGGTQGSDRADAESIIHEIVGQVELPT